MRQNPYTNRAKIENPADFYGRKKIIRKIYERISTPGRPQSVSIVGDRRIGKSSLMHYIYHPDVRKTYLDDWENYLFISVDFSIYGQLSPKEFLMLLSEKLTHEEAQLAAKNKETGTPAAPESFLSKVKRLLVGPFPNSEHPPEEPGSTSTFVGHSNQITSADYDGFVRKIERYKDKVLIFFFDEFDLVTRNRSFNLDFFAFLRGIANNFKVAYITSSARDLQSVAMDEIIGSPFFNIFSSIVLEPFSENEALMLIREPFQKNGIDLTCAEVQFVRQLAGLHPFFLQIACYQLFEHRRDASQTMESDFKELQDAFETSTQAHFEYIWQHLDNAEKKVLIKLVHAEEITRSEQHIIKSLNRKGYLEGERIFSSVFQNFVSSRTSSNAPEDEGTATPRFQILEELGRGGMGVVYKAHDTRLARTVAIKELLPAQDQDSGAIVRFFSEAKAAAGLNHPNIVKIYDLDEVRRSIIMEYVDGPSLKERGRLKLTEAIRIMTCVADALYEVHQQEIIHRDLKPANIMVNSRGEVKITDFGVAHIAGSTVTAVGQRVGTGIYMSPEQHRGEKIDPRSDLFSFGVVFYEIVTGRRLFARESELVQYYTAEQINYDHLYLDPLLQTESDANSEVLRTLDHIILTCVKLDRGDRYPNMKEVRNALKNLLKR
ncbi:MAG: hypothetical protein D6675_12920 [Gemmatimonadetes bacterium]|nr:MAG: hypothetical protein D6675_12920 [Gemmatimonadota bacterium]